LRASLHALRACSACAGDYEDPDRTVWTWDVEKEEAEVEIEMEEQAAAETGQEPGANSATHAAPVDAAGGASESGGANDEFPAKDE
jgi:hypothetical protein